MSSVLSQNQTIVLRFFCCSWTWSYKIFFYKIFLPKFWKSACHNQPFFFCFVRRWWKISYQTGVVNGLAVLAGQRLKMISDSNFELNLTKRPRDVVRSFYFKFSMICWVYVPRVIIKLKMSYQKTRKVRLCYSAVSH